LKHRILRPLGGFRLNALQKGRWPGHRSVTEDGLDVEGLGVLRCREGKRFHALFFRLEHRFFKHLDGLKIEHRLLAFGVGVGPAVDAFVVEHGLQVLALDIQFQDDTRPTGVGGRQVVRDQALHRYRHGSFLPFYFGRDFQFGRFLPELTDAARERMIRHLPLGFSIGGFPYLLRHMTGLAFLARLHGFALVPIPQQVVTLAEVRRSGHHLVAIQAEVRLVEEPQFHGLMRKVLREIFVWAIHGLAAEIVLRLRRLFRPIDLLDEMTLHAGHTIQ